MIFFDYWFLVWGNVYWIFYLKLNVKFDYDIYDLKFVIMLLDLRNVIERNECFLYVNCICIFEGVNNKFY